MPHKVVVVALETACVERKMDLRAFSGVRLDEQDNEVFYGYDPASTPLQRVLEITQ
jgi:hypothetical protein